ncbi:MAG: transcriptional regulator [Frankiales bacterium]|nr:transcriptional regulator [Frankiales bacterium]
MTPDPEVPAGVRCEVTPGDRMLGALAEPHRGRVRELLAPEPLVDPVDEPAGLPALATLLTVLAEPRRQELVRVLEHAQLTQRQLVARLGLSQPLLSHHLKVLREAGLVEKTVCERVHVYRLRADTLGLLAERLSTMAENARSTGSVPPC